MSKPDPIYLRRWRSNEEPATGIWAMRRRLAAAMRVVVERLTSSDAPEAELRTAAERLEQYAAHLDTHPRRKRYESVAESALARAAAEDGAGGSGGAGASSGRPPEPAAGPATPAQSPTEGGFFDFSPFIGRSNPLSPPIELWDEDERVFGRCVFGSAYEGPPGNVHGGYVAGAFDEVLGYVQSFSGQPGMTGRLTVHYRSPTPLHTELRFEAWIERVEGRKTFTSSTLHAGERLCAEAEGLFISIKPGAFAKLVADRAEPTGDA